MQAIVDKKIASSYKHRIVELLAKGKPEETSCASIRRQLEREHRIDLSHVKKVLDHLLMIKEIDSLILSLLYSSSPTRSGRSVRSEVSPVKKSRKSEARNSPIKKDGVLNIESPGLNASSAPRYLFVLVSNFLALIYWRISLAGQH
jgi:hypothetical protein